MKPRYNFRPEDFPITFEALHPKTGAVVWSKTVDAPETELYIPPLAKQLGHRVVIRITFGERTVTEEKQPN
jgi:hypothetical protein